MHVGLLAQHADAIGVTQEPMALILNRHAAERLPQGVGCRFARIGILDLPHSLDFEVYDESLDQMTELVKEFSGDLGPPTAVVGMYEQVTLPAARLRDRFGVPGVDTETALLCRDKVLMKEALRGSGLRLPRFREVGPETPFSELEDFVAGLPGKIVLKPQRQAGSFGIRIFNDAGAFLTHARSSGIPGGYEIEEFIEGSVCHVDGVVRAGEIRFLSASRYIGDCFSFQHGGQPLASVTFDSQAMLARFTDFTELVLKHMGLRDSTFHLEAFLTPDDDLVFLELANRFGGAYVANHLKAVCGIDLARESVLACTGQPSEIRMPANALDLAGPGASGWLYPALPEKERCVVKRIQGLDTCPGSVVLSEIPDIGQELNDDITPFASSGKFVLAAGSSAAVEQDMRRLIKSYAVEVEMKRAA
ncbi:Alanine-anticapsin ligase BacD [Streptomyces sp. YIM 130001]|nr:Alanine-anticapsin ligase BacD [Streptomyces sp. YIM 130001]